MRHPVQRLLACLLACLLGLNLLSLPAVAEPWFEDVTTDAGFSRYGESYGASWGDFNGDGYPDIFANNHRTWPSLHRNEGDGTFRDVILSADGSGIWKREPIKRDTHGATFADADGDGDLDLYVATGGNYDGALLLNQDNVLRDAGIAAGAAEDLEGRQAVWLDANLDGRLDLAFMVRSQSQLLLQEPGPPLRFREVTTAAGFDCTGMDFGQVADLDGDRVAEFVCGNGTYPRRIYGLQGFPLDDRTPLMPYISRGTDAALADFDGDLDADAFVIAGKRIPSSVGQVDARRLEASLGVSPDRESGVRFTTSGLVTIDVHMEATYDNPEGVYLGASGRHPPAIPFELDPADPANHGIAPHDPAQAGGTWVGYDPASGRWTLLVSGPPGGSVGGYYEIASSAAISAPELLYPEKGDLPERPYLLDNLGNGQGFVEVGEARGLEVPVHCVSVTAGDFDNDMDVDVYLVCRGGVENTANRLYDNLGDGSFRVVEGPHGAEGALGFHLADRAGLGDAAVTADYDLDGCLDLFVTNGLPLRPLRHDSGPDQLLRNRCQNDNHWLQLDLVGAGPGASNPAAIGARVVVEAGGVRQLREQGGGYHRWSQNHSRLHLGLGPHAVIDLLEVRWPSGREERFRDLAADRIYRLHEGSGELLTLTPTPGTGGFPRPQGEDACGEPGFDPLRHGALFLYQDCNSGRWSLRATAGAANAAVEYHGELRPDQPIQTVEPVLLEGADSVEIADDGRLRFSLRMSPGALDGLDIALPAGAGGCLAVDLPAGHELLVGAGSLPATAPLDLATLMPCEPDAPTVPTACGAPTFDSTRDAGLFVWQDCPSRQWQLQLSPGGGERLSVSGMVQASAPFPAPPEAVSLEGGDRLELADPHTLAFAIGAKGGGTDGVRFALPADGSTCLTLNTAELPGVYLGAGRQRVGDSLDLVTLEPCAPPPAPIADSACGAPVIDAAQTPGLFVWRECPGDLWSVRVAAGGADKVRYRGQLRAAEAFYAPASAVDIEGADTVTLSAPGVIDFSLNVIGTGVDGFDLQLPSAVPACLALSAPAGGQIHLGAAQRPVGQHLDLATLTGCAQ